MNEKPLASLIADLADDNLAASIRKMLPALDAIEARIDGTDRALAAVLRETVQRFDQACAQRIAQLQEASKQ